MVVQCFFRRLTVKEIAIYYKEYGGLYRFRTSANVKTITTSPSSCSCFTVSIYELDLFEVHTYPVHPQVEAIPVQQ